MNAVPPKNAKKINVHVGISDERKNAEDKKYLYFIRILEKVPIFHGLTVGQFQKILHICKKKIYHQNEALCIAGDESHDIYIIIQGEVQIMSVHGKELTKVGPVGIIGEMGVFTGEPRSASVYACQDCITLVINKADLMNLFNDDYSCARVVLLNVIKDLSEKLKKNNTMIDELRQIEMPDGISAIISKILDDYDK